MREALFLMLPAHLHEEALVVGQVPSHIPALPESEIKFHGVVR